MGVIEIDFDATDQLLIIFCIRQILDKKWEYNGTVHPPCIDVKKAYDSVRKRSRLIFLLSLVSL